MTDELAALREELHQTRSDRQREHDLRCRLAGEAEALRARVAELEAALARQRDYESIEGQHGETGRTWIGPRYKLPPGYFEIANESGEPGPRATESAGGGNAV